MSAAVSALPSLWAAVLAAIGACWITVVVLVVPPAPTASRTAATMPPPSRPARRGRRSCRIAGTSVPTVAKSQLKRAFGLAEGRTERAQGLLGVGRPHEQLADEDGVDAHALEVLDLLTGLDARLRDDRLARRDVGEQVVGAL